MYAPRNSHEESPNRTRARARTAYRHRNQNVAITQNRSLNPKKCIRNSTIGETSRGPKNPITTRPPPPRIEEESDKEEDDEWMCRDDEYDSEDLTLETAKKSKWLRDFFKWFDSLTDEQISDPKLRMHCPACQDGVGAVAWFNGFQIVLTHAENVRSKRVRLHRRFAQILDGEMREWREGRRGLREEADSVKWKGLKEEEEEVDQIIVWPPMLVVQNTRSHRDEFGKWVGARKADLLSCFKHFDIRNVKNAYGPAGHCGVSLLVFDSSATGYVEAECLHRQFLREGRGKDEWETNRRRTHSAGECLLYGYIATEGDMELFNRHSKGNQKHKYELKSYKMMVVSPLKKMKENDERLIGLEIKVQHEAKEKKMLMENCDVISQKLHLRENEIRTIRQRAVEDFEENQKTIEYMDKYYSDNIKQLADDLEKYNMKPEEIQKSTHTRPNCQ